MFSFDYIPIFGREEIMCSIFRLLYLNEGCGEYIDFDRPSGVPYFNIWNLKRVQPFSCQDIGSIDSLYNGQFRQT